MGSSCAQFSVTVGRSQEPRQPVHGANFEAATKTLRVFRTELTQVGGHHSKRRMSPDSALPLAEMTIIALDFNLIPFFRLCLPGDSLNACIESSTPDAVVSILNAPRRGVQAERSRLPSRESLQDQRRRNPWHRGNKTNRKGRLHLRSAPRDELRLDL